MIKLVEHYFCDICEKNLGETTKSVKICGLCKRYTCTNCEISFSLFHISEKICKKCMETFTDEDVQESRKSYMELWKTASLKR